MSSYEQQYRNQPGCLLLALLLLLLFGGARLFAVLFGLALIFLPVLFFIIPFLFVLSAMKRNAGVRQYIRTQTPDHNRFVDLFVRILARVVLADGVVDRAEIAAIREYFQHRMRFSSEQLLWVKDILKNAINSADRPEDLCREFNGSFGYEPKLILCDLLYRVAFADGKFVSSEQKLIEDIVGYLGIRDYDHRSIKSQYTGEDEEAKYYDILGLSRGADLDSIKSAYRKMSQKYHPDKVAHLGEEFARISEEKMKQINEAYRYFKKKQN